RIAGEFEEDIVQRWPPQGQVAHRDALMAQGPRRVSQQVESVPADREGELVWSLGRLRVAAADRGKCVPGPLPVGGGCQLHLQNLPAHTILELIAGPFG